MSFFTIRTLLFVAEILAVSLLLPLLAFAVTRVVRRAALRHLAWLTMFGVLALLPLAALLLPARQIMLTEPAPVATPAPIEIIALPRAEMMEPLPEAPGEKRIAPLGFKVDLLPALAMAAPAPAIAAPAPAEPRLTAENALLLLVLLWAAGLAWNLGRMALGALGLMRLRRGSEAFHLTDAPCELRLSSDVSGPSTFGLLRPVVLLPEAARGWSRSRLDAVLRHEAAHVARRDALNQCVVRLVCAVYWLNPLLWLAARALRREAELAADDAALASGLTPSAYAAELLALAAEARGRAPGIAMAESALAARVQAALAANISRKGVTSMDVARMLLLGLAATLLLGTARIDLALAQEKPVNPAPAAQAAPAAKPAPAAPPARSASPKIDIEVAPRVDIEAEAIKARADAAAAEARARAEAEQDPAKRAQYRQEAARVAAEAALLKAKADQIAADTAKIKVRSDQLAADLRHRMAEVAQQAKEAEQHAQQAQQRALEARARADEMLRRMEREQQSLLAPLSDVDKAVLAAARQQRITVSPAEVDERLRLLQNNFGIQRTETLRDRTIADVAREKLAALQTTDAARPAADRAPAAGNASERIYHVSEIFLAVDRPENDARVRAELDAIEQRIRGGGSFRDLARQHSQGATAGQGGDRGWVTAKQLEAPLGAAVTELQVGDLSRPVRGRDGWYLLGLQASARVEQRSPETQQGAVEAAGRIARAAGMGVSDAQFSLALLYERGQGVPQSLTDAYKWYIIAGAAGNNVAQQRATVLRDQLSQADRSAAERSAAAFRPQPMPAADTPKP